MMEIKVLAFGIAREIFGADHWNEPLSESSSVEMLKKSLEERFPKLGMLSSYMIAVNEAYSQNDDEIKQGDEVAVIPPVSGG